MYEMSTRPPFVDIDLPQGIALDRIPLLFIHFAILTLDYILLNRANTIHKAKYIVMGMHIIIPMIFTSSDKITSSFFFVIPLASAVYSCTMDVTKMSLGDWIESCFRIIVNPKPTNLSIRQLRYRGAATCCRGIMKVMLVTLFIEPLMPQRISYGLYHPWYHPVTLAYNVLFGTAIYLYLGYVEFFMGVQQIITGWDLLEFFDSPYLSSSPRDFWSVRWNKVVQNMLHSNVFNRKNSQLTKEKKKKAKSDNEEQEVLVIVKENRKGKEQLSKVESPLTGAIPKKYLKGLLTFFVSGVFHEMIIMCSCRKITLENLSFFCLQGVAVALEVAFRQGAWKQNPEGKTRVLCVMAQLTFMSFSGRLFLGPFLRYNFLNDKPLY